MNFYPKFRKAEVKGDDGDIKDHPERCCDYCAYEMERTRQQVCLCECDHCELDFDCTNCDRKKHVLPQGCAELVRRWHRAELRPWNESKGPDGWGVSIEYNLPTVEPKNDEASQQEEEVPLAESDVTNSMTLVMQDGIIITLPETEFDWTAWDGYHYENTNFPPGEEGFREFVNFFHGLGLEIDDILRVARADPQRQDVGNKAAHMKYGNMFPRHLAEEKVDCPVNPIRFTVAGKRPVCLNIAENEVLVIDKAILNSYVTTIQHFPNGLLNFRWQWGKTEQDVLYLSGTRYLGVEDLGHLLASYGPVCRVANPMRVVHPFAENRDLIREVADGLVPVMVTEKGALQNIDYLATQVVSAIAKVAKPWDGIRLQVVDYLTSHDFARQCEVYVQRRGAVSSTYKRLYYRGVGANNGINDYICDQYV